MPVGSRACVVTDSRYLHDGMTSWMAGWKRRGWTTASGEPVKNSEIWVALDAAVGRHEPVRWHWVKGHVGHALNERADVLAVAAAVVASGRGGRVERARPGGCRTDAAMSDPFAEELARRSRRRRSARLAANIRPYAPGI